MAFATERNILVAGVGIANQRESVVFWDRKTGEPACPAIIWQCRRTADFCSRIPSDVRTLIQDKTGLQTDAYFSASKIKWGIENVPRVRELLQKGDLCVGTVDSYLLFRFTEGKTFATDCTNASRTMLYNIHTLKWDEELLAYFGVPRECLPQVYPCTQRMGTLRCHGTELPIAGVAGDQQAALFGQGCFQKGDAKITYGTGLFMLFHTGETCVRSQSGLLTTIGYAVKKRTTYALEGSVFNAGSSIQWLRDGLGLISSSAECETVAATVPDSDGVYFVPAFTGLGAPYWNARARGAIGGITRGTSQNHIVRAALESIAYQVSDLVKAMERDAGFGLARLAVDGGASANNFLMSFQADILNCETVRPKVLETTALGACYLAGLSAGVFSNVEELKRNSAIDRVFTPAMSQTKRETLLNGWAQAVGRVL
jgi:glycerol kinase